MSILMHIEDYCRLGFVADYPDYDKASIQKLIDVTKSEEAKQVMRALAGIALEKPLTYDEQKALNSIRGRWKKP
jgi:hypothetical protein